MPKINITKSAVRDFVRSEYLKRYEPLKNARTEALRNAVEASSLFVKFKDLLSSAESVANALEKAGYGSTFKQSLVSCDVMLNRMISNLWTARIDSPKDEIKLLYTIAKPYDEKAVQRALTKITAFLMNARIWAQKKCPHARQCVKGT